MGHEMKKRMTDESHMSSSTRMDLEGSILGSVARVINKILL
jgi:hypothetical protein